MVNESIANLRAIFFAALSAIFLRPVLTLLLRLIARYSFLAHTL